MKPGNRQPLVALLGLLLPVLLIAGIWLGGHPDHLPGFARDSLTDTGNTAVVDQALREIRHDYYRPLKQGDVNDAAIGGVVKALDDRFSNYFSPKEFKQFQDNTDARFDGVGMEVRQDPLGLLVERVYDRSPAARAGIRPADRIIAVGRRSLKGLTQQRSTDLIRGNPGTDVRLTLRRSGSPDKTVTATRASVSVPVVASRMLKAPDGEKVALVALSTFSSGAHGEVRVALDRLLKKGAKSVILDLRHNGGGLLEEGRLVASIFIPEGTIVSTAGRTQPRQVLTASGGAISSRIPVVVLVDGGTASAAEIVTGAIQDRGRGKVVGVRTFGKGVFQEVKQLPNGGALDITVGEYFLPSGRNLGGGGVKRGSGIKPDVRAQDNPKTKGDEAVTAALELLGKR